jgi:hypothetical protein
MPPGSHREAWVFDVLGSNLLHTCAQSGLRPDPVRFVDCWRRRSRCMVEVLCPRRANFPWKAPPLTPAYEAKVGRASCTTTYFLTLATHGFNKTVCNMMLVRWGEDERNRSASLTSIRPSLSSPKSWRSSTSVVKLGNVFPLKRDTTGVRLGLNQLTASNPRCSLIAIRAECEGVGFHLPFKARCLRLGALARTLQSIADRGSVMCSIEK